MQGLWACSEPKDGAGGGDRRLPVSLRLLGRRGAGDGWVKRHLVELVAVVGGGFLCVEGAPCGEGEGGGGGGKGKGNVRHLVEAVNFILEGFDL